MAAVGAKEVRGIIGHFQSMPDPRCSINRHHLLVDVIVISICAVIAGADGPVGIAQWAEAQAGWLKRYLRLPRGIPSHDTIGRVLESLNPRAFQECFSGWLQSLAEIDSPEGEAVHLAIDGKALRGSHDQKRGLGPLHLVSVWATQSGISLGQVATEEKSNEITAIPELLRQLELNNTVITIDAAGCQKEIAREIILGGGDYVLALKGNQKKLHAAVQSYFEEHLSNDFADVPVSCWEEHEKGHGRVEHRYYYQSTVPDDLSGADKWAGLKTIGMAIRVCEQGGKETSEVRYYISSLRRHGKRFAGFVRRHWSIENTLHWSLDVAFREDESRTRSRRLADNLAWLRRLALTLLKQHPKKQSLVMKRRIAGWNPEFLMEVLTGSGA